MPPAPDYSTPEAVTQRALERADSWYRAFMAQKPDLFSQFRRAVERAGGRLEPLPVYVPRPRRQPRRAA